MLNTNYNDYLNLAKYATMTAINQEAVSPFEGSAGMAAIESGMWALKNGKKLFHWSTLKEALVPTKAQVSTFKNIWKNSGNIFQVASNQRAVAKLSQMGSADKAVQSAIDAAMKQAASATPGNIAAEVAKIESMQKAAKAANPGKLAKFIKSTKIGEFFGKTKNAVKSGINAFKGSLGIGTKAVSATTSTVGKIASKCGKFIKGNAAFIAISAGAEALTNVVPTFKQLGKKAGWRQIGKSALKVAGSVGGWAAGAAIGTMICPGAGTLVGALVGIGCSMLGSWAGEKLASKIAGKDELELAQEQEVQSLAQAAQDDSEVKQELIAAVNERLNEEGLTDDGMVAQNSLRRVLREQPQPQQAQTQVVEPAQTDVQEVTNNETKTQTSKPLFTQSNYPAFNPFNFGMNMFGYDNMFGNTTAFNPFGFNSFSQPFMTNPFGSAFQYGIGSTNFFNPYMQFPYGINPINTTKTYIA